MARTRHPRGQQPATAFYLFRRCYPLYPDVHAWGCHQTDVDPALAKLVTEDEVLDTRIDAATDAGELISSLTFSNCMHIEGDFYRNGERTAVQQADMPAL